ncbi:MAG: hypothetical protein MMC33_006943 [Icmadophila ericetorum]|nr:hypothetical protein [Icmadophila ericetorum]
MSSPHPKRPKNIHKSSSVHFNRYSVGIGVKGSPAIPVVSGRAASLSSISSSPTSAKLSPMSPHKTTELPKPVKEIVAELESEAGEPQDQKIVPCQGRSFNQTSDTAASSERISTYLSFTEQSNESEAMVNHYGQIEHDDDSLSLKAATPKTQLPPGGEHTPFENAESALAARQAITAQGEGIIAAIENEISKVQTDIQTPLKAIEKEIQEVEKTVKSVENKMEKTGLSLPPPKIVVIRATDPSSEALSDTTPISLTVPKGGLPQILVDPLLEPTLPDNPDTPDLPSTPVPSVNTPIIMAGALPAGVNGIGLPGPKRVRRRQLMIRKARLVVLRGPILKALLGREVASATEPALRLAAMKVTVDVPVKVPTGVHEVAGEEVPGVVQGKVSEAVSVH